MREFDVLIVGGGPAGSTVARGLRGSGLRVGLLDAREFPRNKVCAGWVTPEVMRLLAVNLDDYASRRVLQAISGFRIGLGAQAPVSALYGGRVISYGIRRIEFDHYLLKRSGAELFLGERLETMERLPRGWCINGRYRSSLVVGAGGHNCPVARITGGKSHGELAVVAQEAEFEMTREQQRQCPVDEAVPELFFEPDLKGYGWIFRKGNYLNVGLGREDKRHLKERVAAFRAFLESSGRLPPGCTARYDGHAYLLYHHARRELVGDRVLLVGDAAGLAYPQSGEGIRPAVESALIAAEVISAAQGDATAAALSAYEEKLQARFGAREPAPGLVERLPVQLKRRAAGALIRSRWFTRRIVIDRWFLQSRQPSLSVSSFSS